MTKSIVTGGAGFVGSHLVDRLIEAGHEVVVIDNLITGKKDYINPKARFYETDICDEKIKDIFEKEKPNYVFHLAAQIDIKTSVEDPVFDNKVNALGSLNIFLAAAKQNVKKIIFVSTGGALYGDCLKPANENTLIEPTSPYAIHKYTAERYLEFIKELHGTPYSIVRPANIYGPRQYKGGECGVVSIFTHNHFVSKPSILFGDGSKTRDYVYVMDVIEGIVAAMKEGVSGVFNIGSSKEINNLEIIKMIEKISDKKFDFKFAPDKPGEVKHSCLNCLLAKKELGWQAKVELEDGIKKVFEWLKNK